MQVRALPEAVAPSQGGGQATCPSVLGDPRRRRGERLENRSEGGRCTGHDCRTGGLCSCCASIDADEEGEFLIHDRIDRNEPVSEARRKAADAALRRAGSMAQRLRPQKAVAKPSVERAPFHGDGMRWTAG